MEPAVSEPSEEAKREAEENKAKANGYIKDKKYALAVEFYTKAIELNPHNHVFYGNRSLANIRLENYGSAIIDADACIGINPSK